MAGNFAKRRKIRKFSFNYIIFEKENLSLFLPFFSRKKQNHFLKLSTAYKIHLLNFISWGEVQIQKKLKLSLNLQVTFW